jgi:hypothetical protein
MNEPDFRVPAVVRLVAVGLLLLAMMLGGCALQLGIVFSEWQWWTYAGFGAWATLAATHVAAAYALYEGEPIGSVGGASIALFTGVALMVWALLLLYGGLFTPLVGLTGAWEIVGAVLAALCIPATKRIRAARRTLELS